MQWQAYVKPQNDLPFYDSLNLWLYFTKVSIERKAINETGQLNFLSISVQSPFLYFIFLSQHLIKLNETFAKSQRE
jgi:hypothetical protein